MTDRPTGTHRAVRANATPDGTRARGRPLHEAWEKVAELIETRKPRGYDLAVPLLRDLQAQLTVAASGTRVSWCVDCSCSGCSASGPKCVAVLKNFRTARRSQIWRGIRNAVYVTTAIRSTVMSRAGESPTWAWGGTACTRLLICASTRDSSKSRVLFSLVKGT